MTVISAPPSVSRLRLALFRTVAGLVALLFTPSAVSMLAPWFDVNTVGLTHLEQARWSLALEGSVDALLIVCLVVAAVRVSQARVLVQLTAVSTLLATVVVTPFAGPSFLVTTALLLVVVAAYPSPAALLTPPIRSERVPALLAMTVPAAAALLPVAATAIHDQFGLPRGHDPDLNLLVTDAEHLLVLAVAGIVAGLGGPGWRTLATTVGAVWIYLGAASIALPDQAASWGVGAGTVAAAVGVTILVVTFRVRPPSPRMP